MKHSGGLRYKVCALCGDLHETANWPDNHVQPLAAPNVIRDEMPAVQNQHDGKFYDSKRAIRASYLPSGNKDGVRLIEVGNDPQRNKPKPKPKPDRKAIRESLQKGIARLNRGEVRPETYQKLLSRPGPIMRKPA